MKIGIGVSTFNRPKHLELWNRQVDNYLPRTIIALMQEGLPHTKYKYDTTIYIADDSKERKGIAYRKNECLRALEHCDYIFLFDDDCFPIKEGWAEFFINAYKESGNHHFLYLKNTPNIRLQKTEGNIEVYNNCGGAFMFLTKEVIEKVGGFNPNYKIYGYEHAGYSRRIHMAGLNPSGMYLNVKGAGEYIYAMDYDHHLPFNKELKHEPSMKDEIGKLNQYVMENKPVYDNDLTIYQPI